MVAAWEASASAKSLPGAEQWPGIHSRETEMLGNLSRVERIEVFVVLATE